jgi:hypothetical protein
MYIFDPSSDRLMSTTESARLSVVASKAHALEIKLELLVFLFYINFYIMFLDMSHWNLFLKKSFGLQSCVSIIALGWLDSSFRFNNRT